MRKGGLSGIGNLMARYDNGVSGLSWYRKDAKRICKKCCFVGQALNCPHGHGEMVFMDYWGRARPPKKRASKKKWNKFLLRWGIK